MSYVMKGDKLTESTEVTAPDALLREALEGIAYATHPGMDYGDSLCLCAAHENARAALAATPPASADLMCDSTCWCALRPNKASECGNSLDGGCARCEPSNAAPPASAPQIRDVPARPIVIEDPFATPPASAERDYLTSREQRRLACTCGHPVIRHTEYGCIDCGTSERTTPQHNVTRAFATPPASAELDESQVLVDRCVQIGNDALRAAEARDRE